MYDRIIVKGRRIIPSDVDQFYYVKRVTVKDGFVSVLPQEIFNLDLIKLNVSRN